MKRVFFPILVAAVAAAGLLAAFAVSASSTKITVKLTSRAETPAPKGAARAAGTFTGTLTGSSLTWKLTFSHLSGPAVAAHIHLGRPGVAGPVAVPLCGPCRNGATGNVTLALKTKRALLAGGAYVNVHTGRNAAGEIRGQISTGTSPVRTTTSAQTTDSGGDDGGYGGYGGYGG